MIGPPIGFLPALIVVALNGLDNVPMNRFGQVVVLILVFNIFQWLKDNLVAPRYIGNKIGLHPVVIFIAIMIGARIDGMLGIIFAIPVASALNVAYRHLLEDISVRTDQVHMVPDGEVTTAQTIATIEEAPGTVL